MARTLVIGDIHGNFLGLKDVLKKCNFKKSDTLISLGDFCDGGNRTKDVIERLLSIPNLINVLGNHDFWAVKWMKTGIELPAWWHQGGMRTAESYNFDFEMVPKSHINFIETALPYYIDDQNRAFVHGGFDPLKPLAEQETDFIIWNRDLLCWYAPKYNVEEFKHVFVGHTTTQHFKSLEPVTLHNVTDLDTGGGWDGRLTIMDVDTFEFWQSTISANKQNEIEMYQKVMKMF